MFLHKFAVHLKGNQTHGIQPGENYTYTWSVSEEDTPMDSDPRCLTRMYHSAVDTPRDIASGLVGPLLICKSQSLNKKNVQVTAFHLQYITPLRQMIQMTQMVEIKWINHFYTISLCKALKHPLLEGCSKQKAAK